MRAVKDYLTFVERETKARHAAGMNAWEAAQDIDLGAFGKLLDAERLAVSVDSIYRELNGDTSPRDLVALIARLAQLEQIYLKNARHGHPH